MHPLPTIERQPPDITPWRLGHTGTDGLRMLDSGRPGPRVRVQARTRGNKPCGALALHGLYRPPPAPLHGRLTLAFGNVAACRTARPEGTP